MWHKLQILKQDYNDTVSQHINDMELDHLEEMIIEMDQELPPVAGKPYPILLKCHKSLKEEIENLLEAALIDRSVSPYAAPVIVVPRIVNLMHF